MKKAFAIIALAALFLPVAFAVEFTDANAVATATKANITWATDINCSSKLVYGTATSYGRTSTVSKKVTNHSLQISGLTANTTYHYKLMCQVNSTYTENSTDYTFATLQTYPDLTVSRVTVAPSGPLTLNKNTTVNVQVRNLGDGKALNVVIAARCPDGSEKVKVVSAINAAASSAAAFTCPAPAAPGIYAISGMADPNNTIAEITETNNEAQANVTYVTTPKPDLVITDADITHTLKETGGVLKVTLNIYVGNNGTAKATSIKVRVEGGHSVQTKTIGSISAGGRGFVKVEMPSGGDTDFTVTVDPNNTISEVSEDNNVAHHTISAEGIAPDLSINESGITYAPSSVRTGSTVAITAKVYNNGAVTAQNVRVQFQLANGTSEYKEKEGGSEGMEVLIGPGGKNSPIAEDLLRMHGQETTVTGPVIGNATIASIAPGAFKPVKVTFTVPAGTGALPIAVTIDPKNAIGETNEGNNIAMKTIPVDMLYPELSVNGSGMTCNPASPTVGDKVSVKAAVRNSGALAAENVLVAFYVSLDDGPFSSLANITVRKISAKANSQVAANWTVPAGVQVATFLVRADPWNAIGELNKTNNEAQKNLTLFLPDLEISGDDISVTGSVAVGSQVTIKANVTNIGNAKAQRAVIRFYNRHPTEGEVLIGQKNVTLNAGGKTTATVTWTVPAGISANPVIIVKANEDEAIYESDFSNNQGALALNARLPDLSASVTTSPRHPIIPSNPGRNKEMSVYVVVYNGGTDRAQNIPVRLLANGAVFGELTIPSINAGANSTARFGYPFNSSTPAGSYTFNAIVDPDNTVTEITDDNNAAQVTATLYANQLPNAVINQSATNALRNQLVQFSCERSTDPDYPDFAWFSCAWKFDGISEDSDGYDYTGQVIDHQFTTSGTHTIEVTVTDTDGGTDTATSTINIAQNVPPNVELEDTSMYTNVEGTIPVYASDPDGHIVSMVWNFGDGQTATTGPEGASHAYSSTGTRTISVIVTDDSGAVASDTATVSVTNPPPMRTTTGSSVFYAHLHVYEPGEGCPCAAVWYGFFRVDYEIKYTDDHVIHQISYTLHSGPAILDAVSDADAESLFQEITAASAQGGTALQVYKIGVRDANQHTVQEISGGPHLSSSESPVTTTLTGLDIPVEVWGGTKYLVIQSEIAYPGQMCADDGDPCQDYWALVPFN